MSLTLINAVDKELLMDSLTAAPGYNSYAAAGTYTSQVNGSDGVIDWGHGKLPLTAPSDPALLQPCAITVLVRSALVGAGLTYAIVVEESATVGFATVLKTTTQAVPSFAPQETPAQYTVLMNPIARFARLRYTLVGAASALTISKAFAGDLKP